MKKTALAFLIFLLCGTAPGASASPREWETARLAFLISHEIPPKISLNLFDLSRHILRLSHSYDLDPLLVLSIIKVESQFRPRVQSHAGAIGLMQVMPIVLREVGDDLLITQREDLYDPYKNLLLGVHYLTFLLEKYGDNLELALMAYNIGPTALDEMRTRRGSHPTGYFRKVMRSYRSFQEKMRTLIEIA